VNSGSPWQGQRRIFSTERRPVAGSCEPGIVEARAIIVGDVAEGQREALIEFLGKEFLRAVGIEKMEERIAKIGFVGR
jgi:hypothetical protein